MADKFLNYFFVFWLGWSVCCFIISFDNKTAYIKGSEKTGLYVEYEDVVYKLEQAGGE